MILKTCIKFYIVLSLLDYIFTSWGFFVLQYPPFNPIAIWFWNNLFGLFGWTLWKVTTMVAVIWTVVLFKKLADKFKFSYYWIIFPLSCVNLFLIGALFQEWYFLGWVNIAPNSVSLMRR